ncbi:O-antigen polymerase [Enterococcus faecium]|uniref:O-antigen polymerase n=1 Tax=Enterococcus faecium TaxID=1352 RepID=UPI002073C7B1|nr:O-antigen polymerase [Enterococcus faecium]MCM6879954.1 oligosaccharide repeat unit polymerase [Enterococcus faecium]
MTILGLILIIFLILLDFLLNRNVFSPVVLFSSLFVFIIILAELRLYEIASFSVKAVLLIELGVICFDIACIIICEFFKKYKNDNIEKVEFKENLRLNWKFAKFLTIFGTCGSLVSLFYMLRFMLSGGTYIRLRNAILGYNNEPPLIPNVTLRFLTTYFTAPILYTLIPFALIYFVKREKKIFSYIVFANLFLLIITTGGRIVLIYTVVQFLAVLAYSNIKISKKTKRVVMIFVCVAMLTVIALSLIRSSHSLFKSIYSYFSVPVVLFSTWMERADNSSFYSNGLSFIYPFTYLLNAVTNAVGMPIKMLNDVVTWQSLPQDVWIMVFPNQPFNAFCTLFYFFYQDFRAFGVGFFSFLFGLFSGFYYSKAYIFKNLKYFSVYLLVIKGIVGSFMIWQLGSTSFFVCWVLFMSCFKRQSYQTKKL